MGIPKYFRWITNKNSDLIIDPANDNTSSSLEPEDEVLNKYKTIDNLFLDSNCLIHPCVRKILSENKGLIKNPRPFLKYKIFYLMS